MNLKEWIHSDEFINSVSGRQFLLDTYPESKKHEKKGPGRTPFTIPLSEQSYSLYLPLHTLWQEYIQDLLSSNFSDSNIKNKILKADMHGALISIWKSTCKSYEKQKGIVLHETMNTFRVITKDNSIKMFPKQNSIFLIEIQEKIVKIFGDNFLYRPSIRAKTKWRQKDKLNLLNN